MFPRVPAMEAASAKGFSGTPLAEASAFPSVPSASTPALQSAKNINPTGRGGGDITIVGGVALESQSGPAGTSADVAEQKLTSGQISIYVVRNGDTLAQIAKMFGVSQNTIIWANDLNRGSSIHPGDTLVILPVSGVEHVVVKGETLTSIVKKYGGDMDEVVSFNNLTSRSTVAVGDTIVIPDGVEPSVGPSGVSRSPIRGAGGPALSGYFLRPIVSGSRTQKLHGYNGVDLASFCGAPILASAAGQVIVAKSGGWDGGYGTYAVIAHPNGTQTLYAHESSLIVFQGQNVVQGQVIGYMGKTGKATGCHVHFEVRGAANPF